MLPWQYYVDEKQLKMKTNRRLGKTNFGTHKSFNKTLKPVNTCIIVFVLFI